MIGIHAMALLGGNESPVAEGNAKRPFYVSENPEYTIVESAADSVRFTVDQTLAECDKGHLRSVSSFVDPDGTAMTWHDFGELEGPGWAANAVAGAHEIHRMGVLLGRDAWCETALRILDHVLEHGFIDYDSGFIRPYREIPTGRFVLNYSHNEDWFCPGSVARIGYQLLEFADALGDDARAGRMREAAVRCAGWIDNHLEPAPNGWFVRRCTPSGAAYKAAQGDREDPFWQSSADGVLILQLQIALTQRGLTDYNEAIAQKIGVFMEAGGIFGSINHDTYDAHENVAYAVSFRTLREAAHLLEDDRVRQFAFETCLAGLERFQMREDRNGVATTGLLYMEDTWDTSYLWENAEAAAAYFEAASDLRDTAAGESRQFELAGLTILRAAAKHHYGPHGFLTEGVDWNNHVGQQHHFDGAEFGAIQYTEPFLNNQHIVEPTLDYLEHLAAREELGSETQWRDCEKNVLWRAERA